MSEIRDFLLISDVDDTLLGDDEALESFVAYRDSIADRVRLSLVYASGRFYESIRRDIEKTLLPAPVAVIGGVGSEVRKYPDGSFVEGWNELMAENWSAARVREALGGEADLKPQPEECQSEFKVSYFAENASPETLDEWRERLRQAGVKARVVYSSNRDLDFLPEGVDKGSAAAFLARQLKFRPEQVMVAGNSANDAALFEQNFHGIVVNNAHDELKTYAEKENVYLSPHRIAEGVRDGVQYWLDRRSSEDGG